MYYLTARHIDTDTDGFRDPIILLQHYILDRCVQKLD